VGTMRPPEDGLNRPRVFVFSGLGSQYYQMGRPLFEQNEGFRRSMLDLDATCEEFTGRSVLRVLYDDRRTRADPFDDLLLSSLANFALEYSVALTVIGMGVLPDYVLGASMGTFAAAAVARCMSPEAVIAAIGRQVRLIESRCEPGGMLAILSDEVGPGDPLLERSEIAAINHAGHYVVAAPAGDLAIIEGRLRTRGVLHHRLPVNFAFHSRWIDAVAEANLAFLCALSYRTPSVPIVCCARGAALSRVTGEHLWDAVRQPIKFGRTIEMFERAQCPEYIDVGPSGSLAAGTKYLLGAESASRVRAIVTAFGSDVRNLESVAALIPRKHGR
jgi:acyl transferase domain-containing protein